jgi:hypothetical protein
MITNPQLIPHIADLIRHAKTLQYQDRYGTVVKVVIQPLAQLDKLNSDPASLAKMAELGVKEALVIGSNEAGIPIVIACQTLKTYLLDPGMTAPGSYLKNEIKITH